ncbi:MAG: TolC family outer membrane protein [Burkholderiales bacterium]
MSRRWPWVMVLLLLAPLARGESLIEVYKLARDNDPKWRGAQAENLANGTAVDQARAGFLPTIRLDMENTETRQRVLSSQNPIFGAGVTTFPTRNDTLSITQPIFRKDVIERYSQAKSVVKQSEFTMLAAEQDLVLRTAAAYLVILAASDSLELAKAEREAIGKLLDLAREKLKMGLGTITNQHDATARYAVSQAREIEADNRLRDARQGLREITGRQIDNLQSLRKEIPLQTPEPPIIERWLESAFDQNLALRARREAVDVARLEVERQRAGYWPSLNLLLNYNAKNAGSTLFGGGSNVETTDITARLTVPFYEGGLTSAVTREAAYRFQKTLEDLEQERRGVERAARVAYDGTVSGVSLVRALKQSVISQESALEAKDQGFKAGLNTLLPVLDAQRDLYLAKRDYSQSRYDYLYNRLKLKQAAGTLSESDLVEIGTALQ